MFNKLKYKIKIVRRQKNAKKEFPEIYKIMRSDGKGTFFAKKGKIEYVGYRKPTYLKVRIQNGVVIVENISFVHRRKGNMTRLFEALKKLMYEKEYSAVEIECVMTEEMENWCKKNNLDRVLPSCSANSERKDKEEVASYFFINEYKKKIN